jgi:hypothetical protein
VPQAARPVLAEQIELLRRTPPTVVEEQVTRNYPGDLSDFLVPYLREHDRSCCATRRWSSWTRPRRRRAVPERGNWTKRRRP